MYARGQKENELTFDFAEGLIKNNLLMVDRETRSVWSQLHGRAVSGPREGQPRPEEGPIEHKTANLGLGMAVGSDAVFFPFSELARAVNPYETEVGGQPVRIHFHPDGLTAWAEDNQERLLPGIVAYRAGWLDFYPSSRVFKAPEE